MEKIIKLHNRLMKKGYCQIVLVKNFKRKWMIVKNMGGWNLNDESNTNISY